MRKICFIDMDGVLTDFETQSTEFCKVKSVVFKDKPRDKMTDMDKYQQRVLFNDCDYSDDFWKTMKPMPYANTLVKKCQAKFGIENVYILSNFVPPKDGLERFPAVEEQKKIWIQKNISVKIPENQIIITDKNKKDFIVPNAECYLIDDMKSNIDKWESGRGKGILHHNFVDTYIKISRIVIQENPIIRQRINQYEK